MNEKKVSSTVHVVKTADELSALASRLRSGLEHQDIIVLSTSDPTVVRTIANILSSHPNVIAITTAAELTDSQMIAMGASRARGEYARVLRAGHDQAPQVIGTSSKTLPVTLKSLLENEAQQKTLSVIVPVHNSEDYLSECITSLTHSTTSDAEFLFIDDGSTDNSAKIITLASALDGRIRYVRCNTKSGQPASPRNIGLAAAVGRYIAFVDSDDWVQSRAFDLLLQRAENSKADIISATAFTNVHNNVSERRDFLYHPTSESNSSTDHLKRFDSGYFSNIWNRIYRTSFLREFGIYLPPIYLSEDFCFSAVSHAKARSTAAVETSFYFYRYDRPESTTSLRRGRKGFSIIESFPSAVEYLRGFELSEEILQKIISKKMNSLWYTFERLQSSLKEEFIQVLRKTLEPYLSLAQLGSYSEEERKRFLRLTGLEPSPVARPASMTTQLRMPQRKTDLASYKQDDIVNLREANRLFREHSFQNAREIYVGLTGKYVSARVNAAFSSLLMNDIAQAKLDIVQINDDELARPLRNYLKLILDKGTPATLPLLPGKLSQTVSVIVPVYNAAKYLDRCIQSIREQTYSKLQIILINDGSKDASPSIMAEHAKHDDRIKIISNLLPSGNPGTPRNQALRIATGEFTVFVDSDDWIDPDYIAKFVAAIGNADFAFASGYINWFGTNRSPVKYKHSNFNDVTHPLYRYHESFTIWDKIYRTDFLHLHDIQLGETRAAVDVPFIFKCYYYSSYATFCEQNDGYNYRRESSASVTVSQRKNSDCSFEFDAYQEVAKWLDANDVPNWYRTLVSVKKVNSYFYTLSIISEAHKEAFYERARCELKAINHDVVIKYLTLLGRNENRGRLKKMLEII